MGKLRAGFEPFQRVTPEIAEKTLRTGPPGAGSLRWRAFRFAPLARQPFGWPYARFLPSTSRVSKETFHRLSREQESECAHSPIAVAVTRLQRPFDGMAACRTFRNNRSCHCFSETARNCCSLFVGT